MVNADGILLLVEQKVVFRFSPLVIWSGLRMMCACFDVAFPRVFKTEIDSYCDEFEPCNQVFAASRAVNNVLHTKYLYSKQEKFVKVRLSSARPARYDFAIRAGEFTQ